MNISYMLRSGAANTLIKKFSSGMAWVLASAVITRALVLLISMWVARQVGKLEYSKIGIFNSTLGLGLVFASAGMANLATRFVAAYRQDAPQKIRPIIALTYLGCWAGGIIIALTLLGVQIEYGFRLFPGINVAWTLRWAAVACLFAMVAAGSGALLAGFGKFKEISRANVLANLIGIPIVFAFTLKWNVTGAIAGFALTQCVLAYFCHTALQQTLNNEDRHWQIREAMPVLDLIPKYAIPTVLSSLIVNASTWATISWLAQRASAEDIAIFGAANQWKTAVLFIPISLGSFLLSKFSEFDIKTNESQKTLWIACVISFFIGVLGYLVICLFLNFILQGYGTSFSNGRLVFLVTLASTCIVAVTNTISKYLAAHNSSLTIFFTESIWALAFLFFSDRWVSTRGALGLAWAAILAGTLQLVLQIGAVRYAEANRR